MPVRSSWVTLRECRRTRRRPPALRSPLRPAHGAYLRSVSTRCSPSDAMEALGRTRASVAYRPGPVKQRIGPVVRYGNSMTAVGETGLWRDMREAPGALRTTLDMAAGFGDVAAFLTRPGAGRIVLTGNGAAYYAGLAVWLAALDGAPGPELTTVPSGVLLAGRFAWREDDALLVISSSGELRDVIEVLANIPRPYAVITADAGSTLAGGAEAVALQHVESQRAVTHT